MTQQGSDALRTGGVPERSVVIALVTGENLDFFGVAKGDSTTSLRVVRPVCRAVSIENGTRVCSVESDDSVGIMVSEDAVLLLFVVE